jgi:diacylglycerol O-acyltransferase / wax synthase
LAQCLEDAVQELLDATADAASLRQPTRKASPAARRAAERKAAARQDAARRVARRYPTGQAGRGRERGQRAEG